MIASSVHTRAALLVVGGGLTPVDIILPMSTSWGDSPVVLHGVLLMVYNTKGSASGQARPVSSTVFPNLDLMVPFILSTCPDD